MLACARAIVLFLSLRLFSLAVDTAPPKKGSWGGGGDETVCCLDALALRRGIQQVVSCLLVVGSMPRGTIR